MGMQGSRESMQGGRSSMQGGRNSLQGGRNSLQGGRHSIQGVGQRASIQGGAVEGTIVEENSIVGGEGNSDTLQGRGSIQGYKAGQRGSLQGGRDNDASRLQQKRNSGNLAGNRSKVAPVTTKGVKENVSTDALKSNTTRPNSANTSRPTSANKSGSRPNSAGGGGERRCSNVIEDFVKEPDSPADLLPVGKRLETLQPLNPRASGVTERKTSGDVSEDLTELTKATQQRQASKAILRGPSQNMLAHRAKAAGGHRRTLL